MTRARRWRWMLVCCLLVAPAMRADEAPSIRLSPPMCYEGCDIRVVVTVPRDVENRMLTIEADSWLYFRASEIELRGESAARLHTLVLHSPPSGSYVIRARVLRADGHTRSTRAMLRVLGHGEQAVSPDD